MGWSGIAITAGPVHPLTSATCVAVVDTTRSLRSEHRHSARHSYRRIQLLTFAKLIMELLFEVMIYFNCKIESWKMEIKEVFPRKSDKAGSLLHTPTHPSYTCHFLSHLHFSWSLLAWLPDSSLTQSLPCHLLNCWDPLVLKSVQ